MKGLFIRNGNKIRINQMYELLQHELGNNAELATWYNNNQMKARDIFDSLSKQNDATGFFEYRG